MEVWTTDALAVSDFASPGPHDLPPREEDEGVAVHRFRVAGLPARRAVLTAAHLLPFGRGWRASLQRWTPTVPALWKAARDGHAGPLDIVHAAGLPYSVFLWAAWKVARRARARLVISPFLHVGNPLDGRDRTAARYLSRLNVSLLQEADLVLAQTEGERQRLIEHGLGPDRITVLGMGVDPAEVTRGERARASRRWSLPTSGPIVGHLANKSREKGSLDLLAAAEAARRDGCPIHVWLAGPEMPSFRAARERYGREPWVTLTGALTQEERRDFYAAIDVFALPSLVESYGIVLLEAGANRVPSVAYAAGGPAEVLTDRATGLLVAPGDVDGLSVALRRLATEDGLRAALGGAAWQLAASRSWKRVVDDLEHAYRTLVPAEPGGGTNQSPRHDVAASQAVGARRGEQREMTSDDRRAAGFWPGPEAQVDITGGQPFGTGGRLVSVHVCDGNGQPSRFFVQGDTVHLYYEFEVLEDLPVASVGVALRSESTGQVVFGKNSFQYGNARPARKGTRLRCHQSITLDLAAGSYICDMGLAASTEDGYAGYCEGRLAHASFNRYSWECARVQGATKIALGFPADGHLPHHGLVGLRGESGFEVVLAPNGAQVPSGGAPALGIAAEPIEEACEQPTVLHVTHWKAGSQWIHKILNECGGRRVVKPLVSQEQVFHWPIKRGGIYPTVYASRQQFATLTLPPGSRHFVVIRDLRDTLVSAYVSFKNVHPVLDAYFSNLRESLTTPDEEDGLLFLMDNWLFACAVIQLSWVEAGEPVLKYEDLLEHDVELVEQTLIDRCGLDVSRERLREIVLANRFDRLTSGRHRGEEDPTAHERKGVAGDWRNHFTPRVRDAFKARYGGVLIATGYEKDLDW